MIDNLWGHRFLSRDLFISKANPNIPLADLNTFWNAHEFNAGKNIEIYLVDSGARCSHFEFENNIETLSSFSADYEDQIGHGTALASLICGKTLGSAVKAKVYILKVFQSEKKTSQDLVIQALKSVLEHHVQKLKAAPHLRSILNFSLSTAPSSELISILEQLSLAGVLVVVANDNSDRIEHRFKIESNESVIAVGAIKNNLETLNTKESEIYAPGEDIVVASKKEDNGYIQMSGNSIAAAFVAGIAAALWSKVINFSASEIKQRLLLNAEQKNGLKLLKRLNEVFEPKWSTTESGIIDAFKPNQPIVRQLRCKNPAKGVQRFKIIQGQLPLGLQLSEDGIISGTPVLSDSAQADHLNYFSTIIRAENEIGFADRNISLIVTENFSKIRHNNNVVAAVQLAKCNGLNTVVGVNSPDNQGTPVDGWDVNSPTYDGYQYVVDPGDCCFNGRSLVRMADGSLKSISIVTPDDFILQNGKAIKVLAVIAVPLRTERKVYQINDLDIYVTDEHPIYGFKNEIFSIDPRHCLNKKVQPLQVGSILKTVSGGVVVQKITKVSSADDEIVFHLFVEGDGSYYVGDILTCPKHEGTISQVNERLQKSVVMGESNEVS